MAVPTGGTCCFIVRGPLERRDLPGLHTRLHLVLSETRATAVRCDVSGLAPDAVAIDALARLRLTARRHGARLWLVDASPELRGLRHLVGLDEVLPDAP